MVVIFDLDGTLADCEHRRHFVDPTKDPNAKYVFDDIAESEGQTKITGNYYYKGTEKRWKPDWESFYEACDKDEPIESVVNMWDIQISLGMAGIQQIWSGRCESVRSKTEKWLRHHLLCFESKQLKMRPEGDSTPDDELKEKWLDQLIASGGHMDYVYDDRPKVVRMWQRRGVFVFNCLQHDREF